MRSYTTRGKLSIGIHIVTVLAQDNIKLYFPPSKKSTDQIPDWTVSVGDLINVTVSARRAKTVETVKDHQVVQDVAVDEYLASHQLRIYPTCL